MEKIKKCPRCGFLIKKNRGCNHMTCGNPICKYEFCWLCMKEAVPNHFDFGPCAGKQFFDPDSFSYRLQMNHPFLYCIYSLFHCIFSLIFFIVILFIVPGFGITCFAYEIIIENDSFSHRFTKKYLKYVMFLGCFCVSLCIQSLVYIFWGIVLSVLAGLVALLVVGLVFLVLKSILKCLFCGCISSSDNNKDLEANIKGDDLELGNNVNELKENNENNDNNNENR